MNKRLLGTLGSVCFVTSLLAAPATAKTTLTWAVWDSNTLDDAISRFEAENPGISVKMLVTPYDNYFDKLATWELGGNAPDVVTLEQSTYSAYAKRGWLLDITDRMALDPQMSKSDYFLPQEPQRSIIDGRWYGFGGFWQWNQLFYDRDGFAAAGLAAAPVAAADAWTWPEFMANARKLTRASGDGQVARFGASIATGYLNEIWSLIKSNGGELYDAQRLAWTIDQPAALEVLNEMGAGFRAGALTGGWVGDIQNGKLGMALEGSFGLKYGLRPDYTPGIGVLPKFREAKVAVGGSMYAISAGTRQADAAWKFLKFLGSEEAGKLTLANTQIPTVTSLLSQDLSQYRLPNSPDGYMRDMAQYVADAGFASQFPAGADQSLALFTENAKQIWNGQKSASQVVNESLNQLNALLRTQPK